MTPDSVKQVHGVLLKLIKQDDSAFNQKSIWEIRHAGLLGLKYAVAVRKDLVDMLMDGTTDAVIMGLCDHDDDVRAVSASTLLPVTAEFVRLSSKERIRKLVDTLWDCLTDLKDDLTASTGAVMDLIAKLFEQQTVMDIVREGHSLGTLVPRLYPFFRHIITNVRVAVLNTLITLLDCKTGNEWVEENVYRLVFQNLIVEERDDVLARTVKAWDVLTSVTHVDHEVILRGTQNWMGSWFEITMTPVGQQLDVATHFYKPPGAFGSGGGAQTADTKASNGKTKAKGTSADDDKGGYNLDAGMILQDFSLVTPEKVMRGRVLGIEASVSCDCYRRMGQGCHEVTFQRQVPWRQ
jgi:TATA-binding protein-associated factor